MEKDESSARHQEGRQALVRFGAQILPPIGAGLVASAVCGRVDELPVAIVCTDERSIEVWNMEDHQRLGGPISSSGHRSVSAVAYGVLAGRPVAVGAGGGLWAWDLRERRQISKATDIRPYPEWKTTAGGFRSVACTTVDGQLVAVTGGYDKTVRTWDVLTGEQIGEPLCGHQEMIWSVACGQLFGRPVALTASADQTVRIWDLGTRRQATPPLRGHEDQVRAVAYGTIDGRPTVVSAGDDRTVRVWDLSAPVPARTAMTGHTDPVNAVALTTVCGRPTAVSGGEIVRVWDLRTLREADRPLHDGRDAGLISSIACGTLRGRPVALATIAHERVRVWDLEEHRRIGMNVPARHAVELPLRWTDPANGDVYDLSRPLVDAEGVQWEYLDYDGFEPIVAEPPVDPHVTLGISDAHYEYRFRGVVSRGPRRKQPRVVHSVHRQYYDFRVPEDQPLSDGQIGELARRYPNAKLTANRMVIDFDPDDDTKRGRRQAKRGPQPPLTDSDTFEFLRSYFDAHLEFQADGERNLLIRLSTTQLEPALLAPYVVHGSYEGLWVRTEGTDLILRFSHYEEDGELDHWRERPDTWLKPLLPLRADLAAGDLSAAYIGWLKAVQEAGDRDRLDPPPRPTAFQEMTPQLKKLASVLDLNKWARKQLPG